MTPVNSKSSRDSISHLCQWNSPWHIDKVFKNNCPLWTYILAEAMHHEIKVSVPVLGRKKISTPQLGPVGGSIVAEVFLGLMFADPNSYLSQLNAHPDWAPERRKHYGLKDFVEYALH